MSKAPESSLSSILLCSKYRQNRPNLPFVNFIAYRYPLLKPLAFLQNLYIFSMVNLFFHALKEIEMIKVIFLPGNGGSSVEDNWFPRVKQELEEHGINVVAEDFPDSYLARELFWLPFLKNELGADENSILVGHSSGAVAAMRFAETNKICGSVLVGVCHTDLGVETETLSGYYDRPWNWEKIKNNQKFITIFASTDDPWIPVEEPRFIQKQLQCSYHEFTDQGHFGGDREKNSFPELTQAILKQIKKINPPQPL